MTLSDSIAIVLAAGMGTRMKSSRPKVMHEVAHRPMLAHVLRAAHQAGLSRRIVVIGLDMDEVGEAVGDIPGETSFAIQTERRGTGHAVMAARQALDGHRGTVFILFGDTPLLRAETITAMASGLSGADISVLGFRPLDPSGYGRLLLDADGGLEAIVEHKDATEHQRRTDFCWSGLMAFSAARHLDLLDRLTTDNAQGEYYLTAIVEIARKTGLRVAAVECDAEDVMGVNSRAELAKAEALMQDRLRVRAMAAGVTMADPASVYLAHDTELGADVVLEPGIVFGPGVTVGEGAHIRAFSHLEGARIGAGAAVGPYARLRPGANIGAGAKIGNFVEVKKSDIGANAKVSHLSYIGDAEIGARANIGAGTITCNYDGFNKWRTVIGEGAFIGSNSALVAPVRIGRSAFVASGSVVTADVEDDALVLGRARQEVKLGWAARFRAKFAKPER
ncbi:N-acetylglucosamine-1-phosphate uridyltransferase / Glucosamine-1-phosphate N-acetyltransferase [hydrothermal vent metagenome]|uniref:N-acetylglucosamine-1-phosphate uridyltransferase / Glucosamine-1-phosphate N-acetyltransferase n=1 Tax=hydrothermal vent metagenome TaxID=652676 RepID=A0A3B0TWZ4_9ZZZZ